MLFSNKFIISALIFSFFSSFFASQFGINEELYFVSLIFMLLIALPSFYALIKLTGKNGIMTILYLSIFAILLESIAIATGFPYSRFTYGDGLGPKIFNLAPPAIFLAWVPMVIGAYESVKLNFNKERVILYTSILLVISDLVIDPAAFTLKVWIWESTGGFYGVPWQNFFGWFLSGLVGGFIYHKNIAIQKKTKFNSFLIFSLLLTIVFWTGISMWKGLLTPFFIGLVLTVFLLKTVIKAQNQQL